MKRFLSLALLVAILCCMSCTPQRLAIYTIDGEMAPSKWRAPVKLKPGDVIIIEQFQAYPHHRGLTAPLVNRIRIPIRFIGAHGSLKDYEKNFLLAVIGSNAEKKFDTPDPEKDIPLDTMRMELITFWNLLMENVHVVYQTKKYRKIDIVFDWSLVPASSPFRKIAPPDSTERRIIAMPRDHFSLYDYFYDTFHHDQGKNGYYRPDPSGISVPHTYISFSVEVNGISYENRKWFYEESTWSVYDWLYSGANFMPGMKNQKNKVKKIGIRGITGSFKVLVKGKPSYEVSYKDSDPKILKQNSTNGKSLSEADLINISPKMLKKVKFKKQAL